MQQHQDNTVLRRMMTGSAMSMLSLGITVITGLVLQPYIINTLGDRLNGMWALVGSLTGWYGMLDFGISGAVSRYITKSFSQGDTKAANSYASIGFYLFIAVGAAALLVAIGISFVVRWLYPDMEDLNLFRLVIIILGVNFLIDFPLRVFEGIISGCLRSDLSAARSIVFKIISAISTFLCLYLGGRLVSLSLTATAISLANAITFFFLAQSVFPLLRLSTKSIEKSHFTPLFSYSMFTAISQVMDLIKSRLDNIIIAAFLSFQVVTYFSNFANLISYSMLIRNITTGWAMSWFTRLDAQGKHDDIRTHLLFINKIGVYIGNFMVFGLVFWSTDFVTRWVGAKYLSIFDTFLLLCLSTLLHLYTSIGVQYLYATAKHYYWTILTVVDSVLYVTVLFFTIGKWGVFSIAFANFVCVIFSKVIALSLIICKELKISYVSYWKYLLTCSLTSTICLIVPYFVSQRLVTPSYFWLFLNGAICSLIYSVLLFWLGFSHDERMKVYKKLKKS